MPDQGISEVNVTHTPLIANDTFTGVWESLQYLTAVTVMAYSDQASAAGGVLFQWTNDPSADPDLLAVAVVEYQVAKTAAAGVAVRYRSPRLAQWFRVVYTNGATLQTRFDLETIYDDEIGGSPGTEEAVAVTVPGVGYTSRSLVIALGGMAEQLMAANAARQVVGVVNPLKNMETIWINVLGAAAVVQGAGSIPIFPGGAWEPYRAPLGAISVLAPTTGTTVTAWEG